jgi:hypothetical protein
MKTSSIHNDKSKSRKIETTTGVKQGGKASPKLFNEYINPIILYIADSGLIMKIEDVPVGIIVYADDTTIICETKTKFIQTLETINKYCIMHDITLNVSKTQWL